MVATAWEPEVDGPALAREIARKLTVTFVAANIVGGAVLMVFVAFVVPLPVPRHVGASLTLPVSLGYLAVGSVVGPLLGRWIGAPVMAWLREGRSPSEREREVTLRQPLLQTLSVAGIWGFAAVMLAAVSSFRSWPLALEVAMTTVMGGVVTSAACYLLAERIGRPVVALALAEHPPTRPVLPGVTARLVLAGSCGAGVMMLGAALIAAEYLATGRQATRVVETVLFLCVGGIVLGLATVTVADPLGRRPARVDPVSARRGRVG